MIIRKFLPVNQKYLLLFLTLTSLFAIILAYISQYFFGLHPCVLCLYQRIPFYLVITLGILTLFINKEQLTYYVIVGCWLILIFNLFLAIYHVGVEEKIFQFGGCGDLTQNITDISKLKEALLNTKAIRCDEPQFRFIGISMAGWNAIYCLLIISISAFFRR